MKTILHIAQAPGGVERYLQMLIKYTDASRYRTILVCSQDYDLSKFRDIVDKIEVVEMCRSINPVKDIPAAWQLRKLIRKYRPDYVYTHSSKAGALGRMANLGFANKSVYNAHGWAFNMHCSAKKRAVYRLAEQMLAPMCSKIVAISDFEKQSALANKICKPGKIRVIFNGIDFSEYESSSVLSRQTLGIPDSARVVGMVGRLSEQKAPDVFVKAAAEIRKKIPDAFFVIVGDGEQREQIREQIRSAGLEESFLITGWIDNPMDYIRLFDVAVLLSRWEGFGLVLAEYMLAKKPIVATRVDAIPNLISNGVNGTLVGPDDPMAAAAAVVEILTDQEICRHYAANGKQYAREHFDVRRVAAETMELLESL